jgi:uncharacterized protein YlxP (DUF503 family)
MFESGNLKDRKRAVESILTELSEEFSLSPLEYNDLFSEMARPIFKRYSDPAERVRDLAFKLTKLFFQVTPRSLPSPKSLINSS